MKLRHMFLLAKGKLVPQMCGIGPALNYELISFLLIIIFSIENDQRTTTFISTYVCRHREAQNFNIIFLQQKLIIYKVLTKKIFF